VKPAEPQEVVKTVDAALGERRPRGTEPTPEFEREHLLLVTDKVAQKVEELEQVNEQLQQEIAERKVAEERMRELAEIIDRAHDAIVIRNCEDRRIVFWNSGAERLYGWSSAEMMGQLGESTFADPKQLGVIMTALLSAGEFRGQVKQLTKDGRELVTEGSATLVRNADGTPRSVLIIYTDVTEQKKLAAQLLRAQRLESIGTLASGVAHDLNNILAPILMVAPILRNEMPAEEREKFLSIVESSAERGADLVRQVLTFARGIEGQRLLIQPVHLIQEITKIAQQTFPKNITITPRFPPDVWTIEADPTHLHQVLLNLCVNARDALPHGGEIVLSAENFTVDEHFASMIPDSYPGPHVIIAVADTGTGIPREIIERIFDPFFTTKEIGKGTGLGLSTVVGIVKSHRGFLTLQSELGRRTTFKIFLPAVADAAATGRQTAPPAVPQGKGELILVVDDEQGMLTITQAILEKNGYEVLLAHDGSEALALFASWMSDIKVVLTDVVMPFVDGVTLIRTMQRMKASMKFIASTGYAEAAQRAELVALGVPICLSKPYNKAKLLTTVHEVISGKPLTFTQ
jgi:two-component system cell cycle sensor histidine kinase/response regulator CckA